MKKKLFIIGIISFSLLACRQEKENFKEISPDIKYRLISFSNTDKYCRLLTPYTAKIIIKKSDTLIYKSKFQEHFIFNNQFLDTLFNFMMIGDSAHFKLSGRFLKKHLTTPLTDTTFYDTFIKIYGEYHPNTIDAELLELKQLKHYCDSLNIPIQAFSNGYYEHIFTHGKGDTLTRGDVAFLNYYGTFLNGEIFDSTATKQQLFDYTCGVQGQVIEAFEKALPHKQQGDSFQLIVPSPLAFGENGSATLIVPPATTVIYYIKIDSILKKSDITTIDTTQLN